MRFEEIRQEIKNNMLTFDYGNITYIIDNETRQNESERVAIQLSDLIQFSSVKDIVSEIHFNSFEDTYFTLVINFYIETKNGNGFKISKYLCIKKENVEKLIERK